MTRKKQVSEGGKSLGRKKRERVDVGRIEKRFGGLGGKTEVVGVKQRMAHVIGRAREWAAPPL